MTEEAAPSPPPRRRWPRRLAYGVAGAAAVTAAAGAVVLGPAGPWLAASLAEGRDVWRLGTLHVEGVGGGGLGDLKVTRATLSDDRGVWAVAENLRMSWAPLKLLLGDVSLQDVGADKLIILRQPELAPAKAGGPVSIDAHVAAISIGRIELAEGVAGPAALFTFKGAVVTRRGALDALHLDLERRDRPLDTLKIDFQKTPKITLDADIAGARGGAFAHLLGTPQSALDARANITPGDAGGGLARLRASLGGQSVANGDLSWSARNWRLAGDAHLSAMPAFADLAARFGPVIQISASGAAPTPSGAPFRAALAADALSGEAHGRLDDALSPVGAVALALRAPAFARLVPETDLEAGALRFDGAVEMEPSRTRFSGRAALDRWKRNGFQLSAEGPLEIVIGDKRATFETDLTSEKIESAIAPLARLGRSPRITIKGDYDRTDGAVTLSRLAVVGPDIDVHGAGAVRKGGVLFKGAWRAPHLGVAIDDLKGGAQGQWRLQTAGDGLEMTVSGGGNNLAGGSPVAALLGGAPTLDAKLTFTGPRARIEHARLNGRNLRLGATGILSGAPTDVRVEASARGPVDIAAMRLTGAFDATGRVTGSLDAPRFHADARLSGLDIGGAALDHAQIGLDLAPQGEGQGGRVTLAASLMDKPLNADARVAIGRDGLAFEDLNATFARLTAKGRAAFTANGPEADVSLGGVIDGVAPQSVGALAGRLALHSPRKGETDVDLEANLERARFGARLAADALSVHAAGPMKAMRVTFGFKGWAGEDPLALTGAGEAGIGDRGVTVSASAQGSFAGASIATRAPFTARFDGPLIDAAADLTLGQGAAKLTWRGEDGRLAVAGAFEHAPLNLLTAVLDQPLAGTIDGEISLSGAKKSLGGDLDFTLHDARLARRSADSVDATIKAQLGGGVLRGRIDATSGAGLTAFAEGQAPVIAQAAPFHLAATPNGRGQAHWAMKGPVESLWALFGPLDEALAGQIDGAGDIHFSRSGVSGAGAVTLTAGSFEDKASGVKLRQIDARVSFDEGGAALERFTATDGREGRITGSGRLDGPANGKLDLTLANMRLVDRGDAKATGGGAISVDWKDGKANLTGDLELTNAEVTAVGTNAVAAVPVIEVTEINRPGPPPRSTKPASTLPVSFNVRIHAPGRIYTRTRGLDAEWSLDVRLRGDAKDPRLFGKATLLRGDFALAGRRFDLQDGEITFAGAPTDAELNVTAVADTPDLTVTAQITGSAADPEIALSSDPALPEDEILPELLFGRSSRELSGFEAAQMAASLASLAGQSAFDIAGAARSAVNLDRLEFREDESGGFLVSGGKYLTRDVFLEVSRGSLGETSTSVEWQVRPRLYVISSFLDSGDQKLAVRWKHDY
jgi:translocation and assembly module TamB